MKYFIYILISILLIGCKKQSNSITCINQISLKKEKYLSTVFKNFEIIPLETIDKSLIGRRINKIRKTNNHYYISYDNRALVTFDDQGKFVQKIQNIGGGPGEYSVLQDFDVFPNGNVIIQDVQKLLFYSTTGEFLRAIPLTVSCFNLKAIDENYFLICASGEEYSIYLINGDGEVMSKHIKTNNKPVLGKQIAFHDLGNDNILYQMDLSNDFLSYNTKTRNFSHVNLLCNEDRILSIEKVQKYQSRSDYEKNNPSVKELSGIASYADNLFFVVGNINSGYKCYLLNISNNTIDFLLTEDTIDDISFTHTFSLLNNISISDSEESLITYTYVDQIIDGLKGNISLDEHPNYQRLQTLFKDFQNIEDANPVLIELKR
jgi:hypothetical protein